MCIKICHGVPQGSVLVGVISARAIGRQLAWMISLVVIRLLIIFFVLIKRTLNLANEEQHKGIAERACDLNVLLSQSLVKLCMDFQKIKQKKDKQINCFLSTLWTNLNNIYEAEN